MSGESRTLNGKTPPSVASDPSAGYVSIQEIANVFTERMRRLDTEIWPVSGRSPYRDELIEFLATLKLELFKRATANYVGFCRRVPDPASAKPAKSNPTKNPAENTSEAAYQERKSRLSKWY